MTESHARIAEHPEAAGGLLAGALPAGALWILEPAVSAGDAENR
ncbi:MAG: hypothetical protein BWZ02_01602 [Lentisphaerae bacterium ADurb.BinA184]|nr:MAG: hypothetical protein BWZ02_01602 [Lentisphaerae bacterium ADurb.BinA184]